MAKPIPWKQVAERDAFLKGSDCRRIERKIQSKFKNEKKRLNVENLDKKKLGDLRHKLYRQLIYSLKHDITFSKFKLKYKKLFLQYILHKYKLFNINQTLISVIIDAIKNEQWFIDQHRFWSIPYQIIPQWFNKVLHENISANQSYTLLAILLIQWKYTGMNAENNKPLPYIRLCCDISGLTKQTVRNSIRCLNTMGVIEVDQSDHYSKLSVRIPKWLSSDIAEKMSESVNQQIERWKEPLVVLDNYDEEQYIGFMFALPYNDYNPFIAYIHPNFYIHQSMLNLNVLIFSLLSKDQLWDLHKVWVKNQYTRSINLRYKKATQHIENQLDKEKPDFSSKHYEQIYLCSPILHYISKRVRKIDLTELLDQIYLQDGKRLFIKNQINELLSDHQIDKEFFWECLDSGDFFKEWRKRYSIEEIDPFFVVYNQIPNLLMENLKKGIIEMFHDPVNRYTKAVKQHRELITIKAHLEASRSDNLSSEYNCLETKTHRINFSNYPIQNISKLNRKIIKVGEDKIFLLMDISSAELIILKWYLIKYQDISIDQLKEFTFLNMSKNIGISRGEVKSLTYPLLYGASIKTLVDESNLPADKVKRFRKSFLAYPGVSEFREYAMNYAKKYSISIPTPLGHHFAILGDYATQCISLVIQGAGAELLRAWLLEIFNLGFAHEVSNIIHDEIILEIKEDMVLERVSQVNDCLIKAQRSVLPNIEIEAKAHISNSWDKKSGMVIPAKLINHLP